MPVTDLLRPNIRKLEPYRCARDDYKVGVLLDANENTHGPSVELSLGESKLDLHRYPDPHQIDVKQLICDWRNQEAASAQLGASLTPENLYLGVGSDECLDTIIRAVCQPGQDKILACPPTYGMYTVSADINDVEIVKVPLNLDTFEVDVPAVLKALEGDKFKVVFLCSPGNPTGKLLSQHSVEQILAWRGGLVVLDEAYIDFAQGPSLCSLVNKYDNLVVCQTLSKSFGLAGLRCGICYASAPIARAFNSMKAPYNLSSTTAEIASRALQPAALAQMKSVVATIKQQRARLETELPQVSGVKDVIGGRDANFLLARIERDGAPCNERAKAVYEDLAQRRGIVVRFRGGEAGCAGCLRVSIGTAQENGTLLEQLAASLQENK